MNLMSRLLTSRLTYSNNRLQMSRRKEREEMDRHRVSKTLWFLYCVFLMASVIIIGRIIYIQFIWEPDTEWNKYFLLQKQENVIKPERGSIMDCNGKLMAISTPMYNIYMDCTIMKDHYEKMSDRLKADTLERNWRLKAKALSEKLPEVLEEDGKDASYYYNLIISKRDSKKKNDGRRHVPITRNIDHATLLELKSLPLYNESPYRSGLIVEKHERRMYPYGELAGRVLGDVKIDSDNPDENRYVGVEGQYDYILRGKDGVQWMKKTDKGRILDPDSTVVEVIDGQDIRLTLDVDIQDIADRALKTRILEDERIESGCVVVMEVETGAVKAMVNLKRDKNNNFRETFNMATAQPGEPGSIMKAATLTTLIEDGKVELGTMIKTNHGKMSDLPKIKADEYITKWERNNHTDAISILDGFKISSNYVFRRLAVDHYGKDPNAFVNRLYDYKLNDAYKFDLVERGGTSSRLPDTQNKTVSLTDLASVAIGYSVMETPLNIVTFYNAIANNGKMMKPYIIDSFEENGKVTRKFKPQILNGSICSARTADTVTRALTMVTLEGTAAKLKNTRCVVAGKTGTARVALNAEERGKSSDPYIAENGSRKYQATFVGFFPADEPKYTAIVTVYTRLTSSSVYGSMAPAMTFKEIVDDVWSLDTSWGNSYEERARVPEMRPEFIGTQKGENIPVPDLTGMGLMDAIYAIENNGYKCSHVGMGHVVSQSPKAGQIHKKGETIRITLK